MPSGMGGVFRCGNGGGVRVEGRPIRRPHRLKEYDYGQYGYYFVALCTRGRRQCLSAIVGNDALIVPTPVGEMVLTCWENIARLHENVRLDRYVLMPNHLHGIIILENSGPAPAVEKKYGVEMAERRGRRSLQGLMKEFKSVTTRRYKGLTGAKDSLWQESFYDRVIDSEHMYQRVWQYIANNPAKWREDCYFPEDP